MVERYRRSCSGETISYQGRPLKERNLSLQDNCSAETTGGHRFDALLTGAHWDETLEVGKEKSH